MPVLDDAIGVGVLGTELGDDGSIRGTFEGGCEVDIVMMTSRVRSRVPFSSDTCALHVEGKPIRDQRSSGSVLLFVFA